MTIKSSSIRRFRRWWHRRGRKIAKCSAFAALCCAIQIPKTTVVSQVEGPTSTCGSTHRVLPEVKAKEVIVLAEGARVSDKKDPRSQKISFPSVSPSVDGQSSHSRATSLSKNYNFSDKIMKMFVEELKEVENTPQTIVKNGPQPIDEWPSKVRDMFFSDLDALIIERRKKEREYCLVRLKRTEDDDGGHIVIQNRPLITGDKAKLFRGSRSRQSIIATEENFEEFEKERELSLLNHPSLLKSKAFCAAEGNKVFAVSDLNGGTPLSSWPMESFCLRDKLAILKQVAEGLDYLHEDDKVHCGLSLDTIIVTYTDAGLDAKIVTQGFVRKSSDTSPMSRVLPADQKKATDAYDFVALTYQLLTNNSDWRSKHSIQHFESPSVPIAVFHNLRDMLRCEEIGDVKTVKADVDKIIKAIGPLSSMVQLACSTSETKDSSVRVTSTMRSGRKRRSSVVSHHLGSKQPKTLKRSKRRASLRRTAIIHSVSQ